MMIGLMRNSHLRKGRLRKETEGESIEAVLEFRVGCEKGAARFGKLPEATKAMDERVNYIHVRLSGK